MTEKLTEAQEAERATWIYRAIKATRGNQTSLGCALLSALGRVASNPPTFGITSYITPDGLWITNMIDRHGRQIPVISLGTVEEIVSLLNALADRIEATDEEREALFAEFRKWVSVDYRADAEHDEIRRRIH